MSNVNAVITAAARQKMVQARAGDLVGGLPAVTRMAFGNGGVDAGGTPISPALFSKIAIGFPTKSLAPTMVTFLPITSILYSLNNFMIPRGVHGTRVSSL